MGGGKLDPAGAGLRAVLGPSIIDLMAKDASVQEAARHFLPWVVAMPVLGVVSWMFDGIFIGATGTREMRNIMVISVALHVVAIVTFTLLWHNVWLWAALLVLNVARGITLAPAYPKLEARAG